MINTLLDSIFIGKPKQSENILIFPLYGKNQDNSNISFFKNLTDAFEDGEVVIKEKEPADVNELSFKNTGAKPVFIMDGEYLKGAKQDRTVNLSILAPASQEIILPVSCVEAGRWSSSKKPTFDPYDKLHYAKAKARRHASVSRSFDSSNKAKSNQREVWDHINNKEAIMRQRSNTQSMKDMYDRNKKRLISITNNLLPDNTQIGSLYCVNNEIVGFDIFTNSALHKSYSSKIIHSVAIDAMETISIPQDLKIDLMEIVISFLEEVKRLEVKRYDSVGLGSVYRGLSRNISASSLTFDEMNIHACAFLVDRSITMRIIK